MTHKQRMLMAVRGELPDVLPYAPRYDLWYNANSYMGTLPPQHRGRTANEIARAEGWALHKVTPDLLAEHRPEDTTHRGIGLYSLRECGYRIRMSPKVEVVSRREGSTRIVDYHTPLGSVGVKEVITEEMRRAGVSITWLQERAIKRVEDYRVLAYIFENVEVVPAYDRYAEFQAEVGEDGIACMMGTSGASPMQHIQRDLLDATEFFIEYRDHQKEMRHLAEAIAPVLEQKLSVVAHSPAEMVEWGANFDDMITYAPYFEKEIKPWLLKAGEALRAGGKALLCHTDGENLGLLDLIRQSEIDVAEAVCPFPMTKVPLDEYYRRGRTGPPSSVAYRRASCSRRPLPNRTSRITLTVSSRPPRGPAVDAGGGGPSAPAHDRPSDRAPNPVDRPARRPLPASRRQARTSGSVLDRQPSSSPRIRWSHCTVALANLGVRLDPTTFGAGPAPSRRKTMSDSSGGRPVVALATWTLLLSAASIKFDAEASAVAVRIQSGRCSVTCFWKNASPSTPSG